MTVFVAGDDAAAKSEVLDVAKAIGFDPVDAGPLANARLLEPLGYLNIQLGYVLGQGTPSASSSLQSSGSPRHGSRNHSDEAQRFDRSSSARSGTARSSSNRCLGAVTAREPHDGLQFALVDGVGQPGELLD